MRPLDLVYKINKFALIVIFITFVTAGFLKTTLPSPDLINSKSFSTPVQKEISDPKPFSATGKDRQKFLIRPLYEYEISGLVVSLHNTQGMFDVVHAMWGDTINLKDLCIVFGETLKSDIYRKIKFSNGSWTCNFSGSVDVFNQFNIYSVSNNHLLADDIEIAQKLKHVKKGDQVTLKGYLVEYSNTAGFSRGTSVTRTDTGNGACETIFLTDVEITTVNNPFVSNLHDLSGKLLLISLIIFVILWFRKPM
jgi:hypothetical protein